MSTPHVDPADTGEELATVIPFPVPEGEQPTTPPGSWPGKLIDLDTARQMAGDDPDSPLEGLGEHIEVVDGQSANAKKIALRSLAARGKSEAEMRQKLADRGIERDVIEETLEQLIAERLIDDQALADHLAWSLQESKKLGGVAIKQQLMRRRLPARVIDQALEKLQPTDDSVIEDIARDRLRVLGDLDRSVKVRRLAGFLARRGYQGSAVYKAIDRVLDE